MDKGGCVWLCIGLSVFLIEHPSPGAIWVGDATDNCLATWMNMDVLDANQLLTTAAQFRQGLDLSRVGPQELHGEIAGAINLVDLVHAARAP